jgi:hypothetical protein
MPGEGSQGAAAGEDIPGMKVRYISDGSRYIRP